MSLRNIVISIIANTLDPEGAADMILRTLDIREEPSRGAFSITVPRANTPVAPAGRKRGRKPKDRDAGQTSANIEINPEGYYPLGVLQHETGYAMSSIHAMLRDPDKLRSKKEPNGRRMVLGADILTLKAAREPSARTAAPEGL